MVSQIIAEVIVVAIAVSIASGITVWALDFSQERVDETEFVAGGIIDCTAADMDIPGVYLVGDDSRVIVSNVGMYDNMSIQNTDVIGENDILGTIITFLPIHGFVKGLTKEIYYHPSGLTCENFNKASVSTECAKVIYDAKPVNC